MARPLCLVAGDCTNLVAIAHPKVMKGVALVEALEAAYQAVNTSCRIVNTLHRDKPL